MVAAVVALLYRLGHGGRRCLVRLGHGGRRCLVRLGRRRRFCLGLRLALTGLVLRLALGPLLFGHGVDDKALVDSHHGGALAHVHLAHDGVGDGGDAPDDVRDEPGALHRVVAAVGKQQVCLEADEVRLVLVDVLLELLGRVLAGEAVGVVAVGQQQHLDVHALAQQHVNAAQAGLDARHVAVVEHRDVLREAVNEAYLSLRERRARRGHDVLHTALVHRNDVRVSLDQETAALLDDGVLSQIKAVKLVALVVDLGLGRVDVLGDLGARVHHAAAESHNLARHRVYGKDDTAVVAVEQAAVLRFVA